MAVKCTHAGGVPTPVPPPSPKGLFPETTPQFPYSLGERNVDPGEFSMADQTDADQSVQSRAASLPSAETGGDADALSTLLVEARLAYDREVATLEAIDDRAMRAVRTAVLLVGFVASAVGVAGPAAVGAAAVGVVVWLGLGVGALLAAILGGIRVYSGGVRRRRSLRPNALAGTAHSTATRALIDRYEAMARAAADEIESNGRWLARVQWLLRAGTVSLSVAAGAFVLSEGYGVDGNFAAVVLGVAALLVGRGLGDRRPR